MISNSTNIDNNELLHQQREQAEQKGEEERQQHKGQEKKDGQGETYVH